MKTFLALLAVWFALPIAGCMHSQIDVSGQPPTAAGEPSQSVIVNLYVTLLGFGSGEPSDGGQ